MGARQHDCIIEEDMEDAQLDIDEELQRVEEENVQMLEKGVEDVLGGGSASTLLTNDGATEDDNLAEGERAPFEEWLKRCEEEHRHFYKTDINTGECTCPDRTTSQPSTLVGEGCGRFRSTDTQAGLLAPVDPSTGTAASLESPLSDTSTVMTRIGGRVATNSSRNHYT